MQPGARSKVTTRPDQVRVAEVNQGQSQDCRLSRLMRSAADLLLQVPAAVETGRPRATQDRQPLWTALNALLGLMDVPAMAHVMTHFPAFLDIAAQVALTGSAISWPALSILRHIFSTLKGQVGPQLCLLHASLLHVAGRSA